MLTPDQSRDLVMRAAAGDGQAWNALVDAYEGMVWGIVCRHRLSESDARDAFQTVWLRLVEHIDRLEHPARVGGWLMTTAARECFRIAAQSRHTAQLDDREVPVRAELDDEVETAVVRAETVAEVRAAIGQLPPHWQALMRELMADPPKKYQQIAEDLHIPVGSIGPTRARCLRRLKEILREAQVSFTDTTV